QKVMAKMRSGAEPTAAERAALAQVFGRSQRSGAGANGGRGSRGGSSNSYIVFVRRAGNVIAVPIRTGLSDQDYVEVTSGLAEKDTVLVLPSASLVQSLQQFRQRFQNVTGGGLPGLRQQQSQPGAGARWASEAFCSSPGRRPCSASSHPAATRRPPRPTRRCRWPGVTSWCPPPRPV